ncbi:hypothetical protein SHK09_06555 [Polaribacter sp. PL03]|uniref:hypothetical protein n=1 Tax=Polaribacter sp. PL03 TaxID=3088353 RepID=UPI0029CB2307|nr:hypothetical protein [Polaribacter sp. PL03]MDX6746445.1 hypothetical protein [Polaribacter sp. PL03]
MQHLKTKLTYTLLFTLLIFSFINCSSKKAVTSNKEFVLEANKIMQKEPKSNLLYILDGKEIDQAHIKNINPNNIRTMNVIKGKGNIKKYTKKKYDGVILIYLKKK